MRAMRLAMAIVATSRRGDRGSACAPPKGGSHPGASRLAMAIDAALQTGKDDSPVHRRSGSHPGASRRILDEMRGLGVGVVAAASCGRSRRGDAEAGVP